MKYMTPELSDSDELRSTVNNLSPSRTIKARIPPCITPFLRRAAALPIVMKKIIVGKMSCPIQTNANPA